MKKYLKEKLRDLMTAMMAPWSDPAAAHPSIVAEESAPVDKKEVKKTKPAVKRKTSAAPKKPRVKSPKKNSPQK